MRANEKLSLLDAASLDFDASAIYLIPSTRSLLERALGLSRARAEVIVVGSIEFIRKFCVNVADDEVLTPAACFRACDAMDRDHTILAFTDQIVSAEFATLLVSRENRLEFFSAFERVAAVRYGMPVLQVLNQFYNPSDGDGAALDGDRVLVEVSRYLRSCSGLGDDWLAASLQEGRMPAYRSAAARRRLRIYASIALSSCLAAGKRYDISQMLGPIFEARIALARVTG